MGSLGEEEHLNQLVRDYIEYGSSSASALPSLSTSMSFSCHHHHGDQQQQVPSVLVNLQEILGSYSNEEDVLIREKILMYMRNMGIREDKAKNFKKFVVTKLKMDGFQASLCKTSWISASNRLKVSSFADGYEYIDVMINSCNGSKVTTTTRLIVDMDFNSQFEVARPTTTYKELINTLPVIFVGTEEKLNNIITLLCSAAKQSLKENNLHVPPWRKASYMQSKWLSKNCKKISLSPNNTNHYMGIDDKIEENISSSSCCPSIFCRGPLKL